MSWHGSLLDAKYAPSLLVLYDLSGQEKAGGLAKEKTVSLPVYQWSTWHLALNSEPMSSTVVVGLLSVLDKQPECDAA